MSIEALNGIVSRLRRKLSGAERTKSLLCLLYFLSPHASDGTLVVACEGDARRLVPGEMVPAAGAEDGRTFRLVDKYDFKLA